MCLWTIDVLSIYCWWHRGLNLGPHIHEVSALLLSDSPRPELFVPLDYSCVFPLM